MGKKQHVHDAALTLTTSGTRPRQRPAACSLAALFMLLLSQPFPFVEYECRGRHQQSHASGNPRRHVFAKTRQPRHVLLLFVNAGAGILLVTILLLVNRVICRCR